MDTLIDPVWISGAAIVVFAIVLGWAAGRAVRAWVHRQAVETAERRRRPSKVPERLTRWGIIVVGLAMALQVMGMTSVATSMLATGGVAAIVLGFAFKEIGENLLAGLLLSFSRSFDVGDLIESDGLRGVIREIRLREVHVRTGDGRDVFIPSAAIFRNALQNFTRDGLRRAEFVVGVDYGDDPEQARKCVLAAIVETPYVLEKPRTVVHIQELAANYVELKGYFWIDTFSGGPELGDVRSTVLGRVHTALLRDGFTFSSNVSTALSVDMKSQS